MTIIPEKLVTKGLLPENLPPIYSAQHIWFAFSQDGTNYAVTAKMIGEPCVYNASKRGGQRRLFGIPHPTFVRDQGLFFEKHWTHIEALFEAAIGSLSRPTVDSQGARHVHVTSHQELPRLRLKRLSRFKFCLVTDVSRFFPSVYTHTPPSPGATAQGPPTIIVDGWRNRLAEFTGELLLCPPST